jgi:hypothetical protein
MKYLLAIIGEEGGMEDASPEEMKAVMDAWEKFTKETVDTGAFIAGEGLQPSSAATTVTVANGEHSVTDGPFAESKEQLGGFYLLECKDLDEALAWAKKLPVRDRSIEVRPVMDYEARGAEGPPSETAATAS